MARTGQAGPALPCTQASVCMVSHSYGLCFLAKNHELQMTNSNSSAGWRHVLQQELLPKLALRRSAARRALGGSTCSSPPDRTRHLPPPVPTTTGGPAQRCQRAWGRSWEKGDSFGQIWNFYFGLFLKSTALARGQSTGDPEQDDGSATPGQGLAVGQGGRVPAGLRLSLWLPSAVPCCWGGG